MWFQKALYTRPDRRSEELQTHLEGKHRGFRPAYLSLWTPRPQWRLASAHPARRSVVSARRNLLGDAVERVSPPRCSHWDLKTAAPVNPSAKEILVRSNGTKLGCRCIFSEKRSFTWVDKLEWRPRMLTKHAQLCRIFKTLEWTGGTFWQLGLVHIRSLCQIKVEKDCLFMGLIWFRRGRLPFRTCQVNAETRPVTQHMPIIEHQSGTRRFTYAGNT